MIELSPKIFDFRINCFLVKREPAFSIYSSVRFSYAFLYAFKQVNFYKAGALFFVAYYRG